MHSIDASSATSVTDLRIRRAIRVLVDSAQQQVPTASVSAASGSTSSVAKAPLASRAKTDPAPLFVNTGGTVTLSGTGTGGGGPLGYTWRQVEGPLVQLSNPRARVATFVAPELGGSEPRTFVFALTVDDGRTPGAPVPQTVVSIPGGAAGFTLDLQPGYDLVGF